ncbi:uncharacterized protein F4807DRAFT_466187 [Annulohypoxylon truncatum]|uniref:uncharacterized protein n=1 Tax=Annulohypoxylon truncatum TaxID=327061 RepID=UPI0020072415|nr:uncharacterized protein F4807DRAFT_466187 [Annulohypoxylon truncatum]KAI1214607.1 hypothetical protein F4807DRAFT_466187 [Annulohypoxylon truncatum]
MATSPVPFTTRVLGSREPRAGNQSTYFTTLLPATHRTKDDHIIVPKPDPEFFERELLVTRLNNVQDWLWICGRPMPPRPLRYATKKELFFYLFFTPQTSVDATIGGAQWGNAKLRLAPKNHQVLISRDIFITEDPELHLVWSKNRIYLKPIPLYLFEPDFWKVYIQDDELVKCARGFLFSYTALIAYESDFKLAKDKRLLPEEIEWAQWKVIAKEILGNHHYQFVNPRYWYGELRLSRLNKVYRFRLGFLLRGYSKVASHAVYADLIRDNFAALATILGYVVIVLTAMQVGLGVDRLQTDEAFQNASYGFTVFSIIAPLVASMGIVLVVVVTLVSNWIATKSYEQKRFRVMNVEPIWKVTEPKATFSSVKSNRTNPSDENV